MKFAIIYRPKTPPDPALIPELLQDMASWMQTYGGQIEDLSFFVAGGGIGTVETGDSATLQKMVTDNPFSPYSEIEIKPLLDPETAIGILQAAYS